MRTEQEIAARTTVPEEFDCVLPSRVRDELSGRKQIQTPQSVRDFAHRHGFPIPQPEHFGWRKCLLVALVAILGTLLLGQGLEALRLAANAPLPKLSAPAPVPAQPARPLEVPHVTTARAPTPALPPGWNADGTGYGRAGVIGRERQAPVPRAELVKLPAPRAELVQLWHPCEAILMRNIPHGVGSMQIRIMGSLNSVSDLPTTGNVLGDAYVIQGHPWILARPPGYLQQGWLDP